MDAPTEQFDPTLVPSPRSRWLINSWTIAAIVLGLAVAAMVFGTQSVNKHSFIARMKVQGASVVTEPIGPQWLIEWAGPEYGQWLNRVVSVNAAHATLSRADIAYIASLRHLRTLDLSDTMVTDDDLEPLGRLQALETLVLRRTKVTEIGVDNLKQVNPRLNVER
jgi:hypothetical protein